MLLLAGSALPPSCSTTETNFSGGKQATVPRQSFPTVAMSAVTALLLGAGALLISLVAWTDAADTRMKRQRIADREPFRR